MDSRRVIRRPPSNLLIFVTVFLCTFILFVFSVSSQKVSAQSTTTVLLPPEPEKKVTPNIEEGTFAFPRAITKQFTSPLYSRPFPHVRADIEKREAVKEAFLHSWNNYESKCFGNDGIRPVSGNCDSGSMNGGLMIIDSLSTMIVMNLTGPYERSRKFVEEKFSPNGDWSLFEFIIRYLGGLLSAAELSGDKVLIDTAVKVGYAILPIMEKTGGFYSTHFSMISDTATKTFKASGRGGGWCLAEVGTFQVEFLTLAKLTGDERFITAALNVYKTLWAKNIGRGMISSGIGGGDDSYYEYIIKCYLLTGGLSKTMLDKYLEIARDIKQSMIFKTLHRQLMGIGVATRRKPEPMMEHLATFAGGMFAIGSVANNPNATNDLQIADELAKTYATVYKEMKSGVMPEMVRYNLDEKRRSEDFWAAADEYILRPESVESVYYMWKMTGLPKYRDYAWSMFQGINRSCRTQYGYSAINGVSSDSPMHANSQESFFLAETLKYLYLTFADSELVSPTEWVFNTEAHPVKIWDEATKAKFHDLIINELPPSLLGIPNETHH